MSDGEEIVGFKYEYNADKTKVRVTCRIKTHPLYPDSDRDGLYDNREININGRVAAPKDPEPLEYNGLFNLWDAHIDEYKKNSISTGYSTEEGMSVPEFSDLVRNSIGVEIPNNDEIAEAIVRWH